MRRPIPSARIVAGVFMAGLVCRLIYLWQLDASGLWDYLRLDPLYYHDWGLRIASGELVGTDTFEMTPLYAYLLGALFKLAGPSLLLPRLLQAVLGAGTCALVAYLGLRLFGRAEALLAGLVLACYGPALFHESQIMKTVLTVALSTACACVLYFSGGRNARLLFAAGALLGLTALAQENMTVVLPVVSIWIAGRSPAGRRLFNLAALVVGFGLLVAPATLRNYAVSGDLVLITSGGGEVFYTGNNEFASGKYRPPAFVRPDPFFEHEDFRAEAARRLGHPVTRRESDAFWWKQGWGFIGGHPKRYALLLLDKLATYFTDFERPDNYSYENFKPFVGILNLPLPHFAWVAPLGLIGLALTRRRWPDLLPLYATIGAYLLSALIFFTQSRYRMPMVPLLALFAAHAAVRLARAPRRREYGLLAWSLPALVGLTLFVNRDPGNSLAFRAQNHAILGEMMLHAGRDEEAVDQFRRALALFENYPGDSAGEQFARVTTSSHYGIVLAHRAGAPSVSDEEVIDHLRAAGRSPDADLRRDALGDLGALLLARGDAGGAAAAFAGAVRADPADFRLRLRLAEAQHRAGRPDAALRTVEEAIALFPKADPKDLASAHYGEALIYLRDRPDPGRAERHLREVLRLDPDHPRADWIRRTLASLGGSSRRAIPGRRPQR
ncbi:MAG: tetratricopeptide repeat protein [Acidobacteriota bacterium]